MKRLFTLMLSAAMLLSLAACSSGTQSADKSNQSGSSSEAAGTESSWAPDGAVTLYCPYGAGGATDLSLRCLAEILSDQTGASVNVLNRTGGGGVVGTTEFMLAEPDGYTLAMSCNSFFSTQPFLNSVEYTVDDFTLFVGLNKEPNVLVVRSDAPYTTLEEFVTYYKEHPDETILYGHSGNGGIGHLTQTFFLEKAGLENYESVPYASGQEGVTALLGGHVTMATTNLVESAALLESGQIRPLCVIDSERLPVEEYKDLPTMEECGYDVTLSIWKFLALPAGTPDEIVSYWYDQVMKAYEDERWISFCEDYNLISNKELTEETILEALIPEIEETHQMLIDAGLAIN